MPATDTPLRDIGSMTIGEAGWKPLDARTLRWLSPPGAGPGRSALLLKGHGIDLAITSAYVPGDVDPDDDRAVIDEIEGEDSAVLPLPALVVLHSALGMCIAAMQAAQGVTIHYGHDAPEAP